MRNNFNPLLFFLELKMKVDRALNIIGFVLAVGLYLLITHWREK